MSERIECERLQLRELSLAELTRIQNNSQDFLPKSILTAEIQAAVAHKIAQMQKLPPMAHPWVTYWLIAERMGGMGIGLIGSKNLPDAEGYVELGYAVVKERRNLGYMTEALVGFLDWLFACSFCNGARLSIRDTNLASIKVAQKCGFWFEKKSGIYEVYRFDF